jgi:hypothetical protein
MKTFEIIYQAAGAGTGKTVNMKVFKPDHSEDAAQAAVLTEVGTTGRYYGSFDADAPDWSVNIEDSAGGKSVKHFGKDRWDSHGVADAVANVQTAVDAVNTAIGTLQSLTATIDGKIDAVGLDVGGLVTSVAGLATELGVIEGKIDDLESPSMIG